jgi:hypothetical protein
MNVGEDRRALAEAESKAMAVAETVLRNVTGHAPIDFVSIEPAEWRDASLGWPEPGMSYAQMMTDGFKIMARSAGKLFECRVSGDNVRYRVIKGE